MWQNCDNISLNHGGVTNDVVTALASARSQLGVGNWRDAMVEPVAHPYGAALSRCRAKVASIDSATSLFDPCGMMSWSAGRLQKGPAASAAHGATSIRKLHTLILIVFWNADGGPTSNQHQVDDDSWANFLWEEVVPLRSPFWPRDLRATTSLAHRPRIEREHFDVKGLPFYVLVSTLWWVFCVIEVLLPVCFLGQHCDTGMMFLE